MITARLGSDQASSGNDQREHEQAADDPQPPARVAARSPGRQQAADEAARRPCGQRDRRQRAVAVSLCERGDRHLHAAERNSDGYGEHHDPAHGAWVRARPADGAGARVVSGRLPQRPVGDESEHADEAEDAGGGHRGIRREQRGQQADDQRADHEQQLLQRCLERKCGRQLLLASDHRRPQHPHGRPDRREHGAGERGGGDQRPHRRRLPREQQQQEQRGGKQRAESEQHGGRSVPVDQPPSDRRGGRCGQRLGCRNHAGLGVAAAVASDQQNERQRGHADGHAGDQPGGHHPRHGGIAEQLAVVPQPVGHSRSGHAPHHAAQVNKRCQAPFIHGMNF